jgi:hypothetical protein
MKKKLIIFFILLGIVKVAFCQPENIDGMAVEVSWPKEYNLKTVFDQEDSTRHIIKLVPEDETIDNWQTLAVVNICKKAKLPIENVPMEIFKDIKKKQPTAKLTFLNRSVKNGWCIFKIEAIGFADEPNSVSELVYVEQFETIWNILSVTVKKKYLSDSFTKKWINVFKGVQIDYAIGSY